MVDTDTAGERVTKRIFLFLLLLSAILIISGCQNPQTAEFSEFISSDPVEEFKVGEERTFNVVQPLDYQWYELESTLLSVGTHCLIYVENSTEPGEGLDEEAVVDAELIAEEFDSKIHDQITEVFGDPEDVDGNGRTILLLLDIVDGYEDSGGYVGGFFDPVHMFSQGTEENSNEADMIFLDIDPADAGSQDFYSTIAHEFQHMINFSRTYMQDGREQDLWINEGLSAGAEYVYSGEIDGQRLYWYNNDPMGTIQWGNNFFVWNGYWEGENIDTVMDNYATVYLFFQWLRLHADNGTDIYGDILASGDRDYRAVTEAAALRIDDRYVAWEDLLESWHLANILNLESGYYGYGNRIDVAMPLVTQSDTFDWFLFAPGEGSGSTAAGENTPPSPPPGSDDNIRYLGIEPLTADTAEIDRDSPYTGNLSLVFNTNPDNLGSDETGFVASSGVAESFSSRTIVVADPEPGSRRMGIHFTPEGGPTEISRRKFERNRESVRPGARGKLEERR